MMNLKFSRPGEKWTIPFTYIGRRFSREVFVKIVSQIGDACRTKVTTVKKRMPVMFSCSNRSPFNHLFSNLDGRKVGQGLSKFSQQMNQQIFNSKFTLFCSHDIENIITPFFDMEGSVVRMEDNPLSPFRYPLIKKGVFNAPFSDKVTAKIYNYPITGSAVGAYNVTPFPGISHFQLSTTHEKLQDLLCGENGILVINVSNVVYGEDGVFSCITKEAFLTDGNTLIGKLPPLKISTSSKSMFGNDYLGCTRHALYPMYGQELFGFHSNVELV
jgi:PmbA protein